MYYIGLDVRVATQLSSAFMVEDSTTPLSWRILPGPREIRFKVELIVAERLRGLDEQSAPGGNGDREANNENESDNGHKIGERI